MGVDVDGREGKAGHPATGRRLPARISGLPWLLAFSLAAFGSPYAQQDYTLGSLPPDIREQWQIQGEYYGTPGKAGPLGAWLVANGHNRYTVVFLPGGLLTLPTTGEGGQGYGGWIRAGWNRTEFSATGTLDGADFVTATSNGFQTRSILGTGEDRILNGTMPTGEPFSLERAARKSPTQGLKPQPSWNAKAWFESSRAEADLAKWDSADNPPRLVLNRYLDRGAMTREAHGAGFLHIEFLGCFNPAATGQFRSNSGVYLQRRYQVQILDSFGEDAHIDGFGAVYAVRAPLVNAALPPLGWQTLDIYFIPRAASQAGGPESAATLTVYANGVKVQDNTPVPNLTPEHTYGSLLDPGPLYLENHGNAVAYDNIWFIPGATEGSLPYREVLESAGVTEVSVFRAGPLPVRRVDRIPWVRAEFDPMGRKIDRENHYISCRPSFAPTAAGPRWALAQ